MKIPIDSYYIDLREIIVIGPLRYPVNSMVIVAGGCEQHRGFGCSVWCRNRSEPFWLTMGEGEVDPYQIDDAKNAFTRAVATSNYQKFVSDWQAVS